MKTILIVKSNNNSHLVYEKIFEQEKIPYSLITLENISKIKNLNNCILILPIVELSLPNRKILLKYINDGLAVITQANTYYSYQVKTYTDENFQIILSKNIKEFSFLNNKLLKNNTLETHNNSFYKLSNIPQKIKTLAKTKDGETAISEEIIGKGKLIIFHFDFVNAIFASKKHYGHFNKNYGKYPNILLRKYLSKKSKDNSNRELRLLFKSLLYRYSHNIIQIWYWPQNYSSVTCLRLDADFPLALPWTHKDLYQKLIENRDFFIKKSITIFVNFQHINFSKRIINDFKKCNLETHGGSNKIKHMDIGYNVDNISKENFIEMFQNNQKQLKISMFAPPCEHISDNLIYALKKVGIKTISAGHFGKDGLPFKFDGDMYNIPTSNKELLSDFPIEKYIHEFKVVNNANSLFCPYFHPNFLTKSEKNLKTLFNFIDNYPNNWLTSMQSMLDWWTKRNGLKIEHIKNQYKIINSNQIPIEFKISTSTYNSQTFQNIKLLPKQSITINEK